MRVQERDGNPLETPKGKDMRISLTLTKTYSNGATYKTIVSDGTEAIVKAEKDAEDAEFIPHLEGTWEEEIRPDYFR
jgi:hypothetical protein